MQAVDGYITIPVAGHVFSTAKNLHHAPYDEKLGRVDFRPAFEQPVAESEVYGFEWGDRRVSAVPGTPTEIRINALYAKQEKLLDVSYCISPKCGKVEFETWRHGYIILPQNK